MICPCGRDVILGPGNGNRLFQSHCSHYCKIYYEDPDKYPKRLISESKHHKNHWVKPPIEVGCEVCDKKFNLLPHTKKGNTLFCGRECHAALLTTNKGHRDWTILKLVQLYGPISAEEVAKRYRTNKFAAPSGRSIGNILKLFKARGIVEKTNKAAYDTGRDVSIYTIKTDLPLGMVIKDKIKLKS